MCETASPHHRPNYISYSASSRRRDNGSALRLYPNRYYTSRANRARGSVSHQPHILYMQRTYIYIYIYISKNRTLFVICAYRICSFAGFRSIGARRVRGGRGTCSNKIREERAIIFALPRIMH